jgi:hypothetical protein
MINANEARALVPRFNKEVEQYLKFNIEPVIRNRAAGGECNAFVQIGSIGEHEHMSEKITPTEQAVIDSLNQNGYKAFLAKRETGSENEFGFSIRW